MNPDRLLFGVIGSVANLSLLKKEWNHFFLEQEIDAFLDSYPTPVEQLPERLSEMFHFDRRGYIVGKPLQEAIIPLLDAIDPSAAGEGSVDTVVNIGGVMTGYYTQADTRRQRELFFQQGTR